MRTIVRFEMYGTPDREAVEADVSLAIFAAECVYGRPRVRMEASYVVDEGGEVCLMGASGEAGEAAARIFGGLTAARLGETALNVKRI
jgi:hypothetical protein